MKEDINGYDDLKEQVKTLNDQFANLVNYNEIVLVDKNGKSLLFKIGDDIFHVRRRDNGFVTEIERIYKDGSIGAFDTILQNTINQITEAEEIGKLINLLPCGLTPEELKVHPHTTYTHDRLQQYQNE